MKSKKERDSRYYIDRSFKAAAGPTGHVARTEASPKTKRASRPACILYSGAAALALELARALEIEGRVVGYFGPLAPPNFNARAAAASTHSNSIRFDKVSYQ